MVIACIMHSTYTLYRVIQKIVLKHKQYSLLYSPLNIQHKLCLKTYFSFVGLNMCIIPALKFHNGILE